MDVLKEERENDVVEAYCYVVDEDELILSMYIRSRIFNNMIAEYFGLVGLCQLQLFCMQLTKAYEAKMSCNQVAY